MNVEQGCFTPLVFLTYGGMGRECRKFYSVLAEIIAIKRKQEYKNTSVSLWFVHF